MSQRDPDNSPPTLNELTIWQRGCAAGIASLVSSVFLNPIDVVKTRMQAQAAAKRSVPSGAGAAAAWRYSPGSGLTAGLFQNDGNAAIFVQNPPVYRVPPQSASSALPNYRSSFDGLFKIARHEGLQSLWRGTDAAVLLTVPLVAIYLPLYDHLLERCSPAGGYAPLVAGAASRAVAGFATAPLELARVRLQAAEQGPRGSASRSGGILQQLASTPGTSRLQRITSMWTGMGASLAKDVPFAALYWALLEPLRGALMRHDYVTLANSFWQNGNINELPVVADVPALPRARTPTEILLINIGAAGTAASLAAVVTTPFDVVKTKQQTAKNGKSSSIAQCLVKVYKGGGVRALFAGAGPRTTRTAAGYAIVTSLFEVFKTSWARQPAAA